MAKKTVQKIVKAEDVDPEEEDYTELNYVMNIETLNITVQEGGLVIFQSGNPPPLPPYGGG